MKKIFLYIGLTLVVAIGLFVAKPYLESYVKDYRFSKYFDKEYQKQNLVSVEGTSASLIISEDRVNAICASLAKVQKSYIPPLSVYVKEAANETSCKEGVVGCSNYVRKSVLVCEGEAFIVFFIETESVSGKTFEGPFRVDEQIQKEFDKTLCSISPGCGVSIPKEHKTLGILLSLFDKFIAILKI